MKNILKIIWINLVIFLLGIVCLETVWRIYFAGDIRFSVNVQAGTEYYWDVSNIYKTGKKEIFYSRDKNGFRGNYNNPEDIDILVVGGSTTDQKFIDNSQTWDNLLRELFRSKLKKDVVIINAGVVGQSTFGHLKNFDLWFSRINELAPKYVLFYVGINDFYKDEGYKYDNLETSAVKEFIKRGFVYYLYRLTKGIYKAKKAGIAYKRTEHPADMETTDLPLITDKENYEDIMHNRLNPYRKRLHLLADRTKELGATPIFVTQRFFTYWIKDGKVNGIKKESLYDDISYNGVDMYYMFKILNKATMDICRQVGGICVDLESELTFDRNDFFDNSHTTPDGNEKVAKYLFNKLRYLYE